MQAFNPDKYTKYEKARMIGSRALQIAMGAPFLIKLSEEDVEELKYNPISISKLEFEKGLIPLTITRPLPKAITESASVEEISTLGKKLVKEIRLSSDKEPESNISMKEIMKEMHVDED